MTDLAHTSEFLARVLAWPQENEPAAFVNVHWTFVPKDLQPGRKLPWTGRACRDVKEAVNTIKWAQGLPDTRDFYVCMSSQRDAQEITTAKGRKLYKPIRLAENAVKLKSLFLDVDVKGGDTGYPDFKAAVAAMVKFVADTGLPKPSMCVASGGGLHAHWVVARALSPEEWYPLACALVEATKRHGLKCDTAVTTDAARVLRIPQTLNHKTTPPRPVRMAGKPTDFDYSVERIERSLAPYKVEGVVMPHLTNPFAGILPQRKPLTGTSDLSAGIETAMPQLEIRACLDAIPNTVQDWNRWNTIGMRVYAASEGADYGLEEWKRWSDKLPAAGAATDTCELRWETLHTSPPSRTGAGALVNEARTALGDPKWTTRTSAVVTPQVTGLGGTAQVMGGPAPQPLTGQAAPAAVPPNPVINDHLPNNYSRDARGIVSLMGLDENGATTRTPISDYPITKGWLQKDPWMLHFNTVTEHGREQQIDILTETIGTSDMRRELQSQGFMLSTGTKKYQMQLEFLVSWVKKLQESKDVVASAPFGWSIKAGQVEGFIYAGRMWGPGGDKPAANPDPVIARQYAPTGDITHWMAVAKMILDQKRPETAAILATAFAAPLVQFTGQLGTLMSVYSSQSGVGKTTALEAALAVWGNPIKAKNSLTDTQNSVMNKIGELRSLPIYWDELKSDSDVDKFVKITFQVTGGKEKARMTSRATQRDLGTWKTLMLSASNDSLLDHVVNRTNTTTAGLYRVFEYEVHKAPKSTQIDPSEAGRLSAKLHDNYGRVGEIYAKFLGENATRIEKEMGDYLLTFGREVKTEGDERFWMASIAAICLGATYANELGFADFDVPDLRAFMMKVLLEMRAELTNRPIDMADAMNVSNVLTQFLSACRARHMILTNRVHISRGKPPTNSIKVLSDVSRLDAIYVHAGLDNKILRISSSYFSEWLTEKGYSRHIILKAMTEEMGCAKVVGRMASGCGPKLVGGTEFLLQIDLSGHPLADFISEA